MQCSHKTSSVFSKGCSSCFSQLKKNHSFALNTLSLLLLLSVSPCRALSWQEHIHTCSPRVVESHSGNCGKSLTVVEEGKADWGKVSTPKKSIITLHNKVFPGMSWSSQIDNIYLCKSIGEQVLPSTQRGGSIVMKPPQVSRQESAELTNVSLSLSPAIMTNYPEEASSRWRWRGGQATEHSDIEKRQTVGVCLLPGREWGTAAWLLTAHQPAREEALARHASGAIGWYDYSATSPQRFCPPSNLPSTPSLLACLSCITSLMCRVHLSL